MVLGTVLHSIQTALRTLLVVQLVENNKGREKRIVPQAAILPGIPDRPVLQGLQIPVRDG